MYILCFFSILHSLLLSHLMQLDKIDIGGHFHFSVAVDEQVRLAFFLFPAQLLVLIVFPDGEGILHNLIRLLALQKHQLIVRNLRTLWIQISQLPQNLLLKFEVFEVT